MSTKNKKNKVCPECRKVGHDSTGDHMFLVRDGTGYLCNHKEYHSNGQDYFESIGDTGDTGVGDTKGDKSDELFSEEVAKKMWDKDVAYQEFLEITRYPSTVDESRDISKATSEHFGTLSSFNESNGIRDGTYYPIISGRELVGFKKRTMLKSFSIISLKSLKGVLVNFFGQDVCPTNCKKLLITEGEEDSQAAFEMLYDKYPKYKPAVVSLPFGTGSTQCVLDNKEFLSNFEEILICTDMDVQGRECAEALCKIIGDRARLVILGEKDASDMKVKGKHGDFVNAYFNAKPWSPSDVVKPGDILEDILGDIEYGLDYPWPSLTSFSYGLFTKQIVSIAASVGGGKSTFMNQLTSHLIYNLRQKVALFPLEETPVSAMKKLIAFESGIRVDLPGTKVAHEDIKGYVDIADELLFLYDAQGYLEWASIKGTIRYMASTGTKFFVIDPLTAVVAGLSSSLANELLNSMMSDLAKLVQSLDITVFLVSHLNNAQGKAHSEGGRVTMDQFTGSRAVVRWSHLSIGLERNQQSDDEDEKNTTVVRVLKNRLAGTLGTFNLKYVHETGRLTEVDYEF